MNRPTTVVLTALAALALSGCVASDPVTPALGAESAQRQAEAGQRAVAATQLDAVAQAAKAYAQLHGSTSGFAAALQAEEPHVATQLHALTDTSATMRYAPTRCLTQLLPVGTPTETPC